MASERDYPVVRKSGPCIGIIGGTIWGNRGAESMLTTTIGMLRQEFPHARFLVFSYYPAADRNLVKDTSIKILSGTPFSLVTKHFVGAVLIKIVKLLGLQKKTKKVFKVAGELSECDALLDIGGITFSDGREKYLPFNILTIWPAMILGVPVIKLSQALGPFENRINRMASKLCLPRCKHIFARGHASLEHLRSLGLSSEKFSLAPDIAFRYDPRFSLSEENIENHQSLLRTLENAGKAGKKIIALAPSGLVQKQSQSMGKKYLDTFLDLIRDRNGENYFFVVLPNASREGSEKTHNNDLIVIEKLKAQWDDLGADNSNVRWITYDINSAAIRDVVSTAELLITSRFHAMIAGLCVQVPVLVIGWSHKYHETLEFFGLEEYAYDFRDVDASFKDKVDQMLDQKAEIKNQISAHLAEIQTLSADQFKFIVKAIK